MNFGIDRAATEGTVAADDDAAAARFWSAEEIRAAEDEAFLRFSGKDQVLDALADHP